MESKDYVELLKELNSKYDKLYTDLGSMCKLIMDIHDKLSNQSSRVVCNDSPDMGSMYEAWKSSTSNKLRTLVNNSVDFESTEDALKAIYQKMTNVYGVCWDQERMDYREQYDISGRIYNLDIIWNKEILRSIFNGILGGMIHELQLNSIEECSGDQIGKRYGDCDAIIRPLVEKNHDSSRYNCATFHRVYAQMNKNGEINWDKAERRYINKYGSNGMSRKLVIESSPTLMKKFKESVSAIMEG